MTEPKIKYTTYYGTSFGVRLEIITPPNWATKRLHDWIRNNWPVKRIMNDIKDNREAWNLSEAQYDYLIDCVKNRKAYSVWNESRHRKWGQINFDLKPIMEKRKRKKFPFRS